MDAITALGTMATVANTVNQLTGNDADKTQQYNLELMREQQRNNRANALYQSQLQKDMYEYTGYESKVRQMKAAGLNPALMYSQGSGGVTGNISIGNSSLPSSPNVMAETANKTAATGMMLQLAKLQSEIKVNESQAELNKAAATTSAAQPAKIGAETTGINIDNMLKQNELEIKKATQENDINRIIAISNKAKVDTENAIVDLIRNKTAGQVELDTAKTKVDQYNANLQNTLAEIANKQAGTELDKQKRIQSINEVAQRWMEQKIDVGRIAAELKIAAANNQTSFDNTLLGSISHLISNMLGASIISNSAPKTVIQKIYP